MFKSFEDIKKVVGNYDLEIISTPNFDDNGHTTGIVYTIGHRGEYGAGIRPFSLSPTFNSEKKLIEWANASLLRELTSLNWE